MIDIDQLDEQFGIEGEIGFNELADGIIYATVSNKYAEAEISLYGAHVMLFRPVDTFDVLWMSPESEYEPGKAIRGGIPVCFPWFSKHPVNPDLPSHGFARLMNWEVTETASLPEGETLIRLQLISNEETKKMWPYDFIAELTLIIGRKLNMELSVKNTGNTTFEYSSGLHSYYNISAIENISIEGLQGSNYTKTLETEVFTQTEELLIIDKEINRVYNSENDCVLHDPVLHRKIIAGKQNSKTTVVWNPWDNCKNFSDMPENSFEAFVCIEAVNAFNDKISLEPGQEYTLYAVIGVE